MSFVYWLHDLSKSQFSAKQLKEGVMGGHSSSPADDAEAARMKEISSIKLATHGRSLAGNLIFVRAASTAYNVCRPLQQSMQDSCIILTTVHRYSSPVRQAAQHKLEHAARYSLSHHGLVGIPPLDQRRIQELFRSPISAAVQSLNNRVVD